MALKDIEERLEVDAGERVDEFIACWGGGLEEANLFGVGVETVGFGIEGQPGRRSDARGEFGQFYVVINHWKQLKGDGRK
jgi:hypothetical protein